MVYGLPAGVHPSCLPDEICAAIGAPSGTPLPRLVSHELQRPGRVCSYVHEGHRPDGSAFCVSALYVYDEAVRGVPTHSALERIFHAFFTVGPGSGTQVRRGLRQLQGGPRRRRARETIVRRGPYRAPKQTLADALSRLAPP